jgi:cyclopropane-fatty-acyl-phospholipid synthase
MASPTVEHSAPVLEVPTESRWSMRLLERNLVPDFLVRRQIRRLLAQRLREENKGSPEAQQVHLMRLIAQLKASPIAIDAEAANAQHYEVPSHFYELCLGKHLKYSCAYWPADCASIDDAEEAMLKLTCEHAQLRDGDSILELGCGWGSLSLFMAERFPNSCIVAVSNSRSQKAFIDGQARARGLSNLEVITANMNSFDTSLRFDRVVSVEMFEHMRNYQQLMANIASWMKPAATLFVHIFTHVRFAYLFEVRDHSDWLSKYFFTGGIMPSDNLLLYFQDDLKIRDHWQISGTHYAKTAASWLRNIDSHQGEITELFLQTYGALHSNPQAEALKWFVYWRVFFMACAELWVWNNGNEWLVSHYLFQK